MNAAAPRFKLPPALEAGAPPEERAGARDAVRLMVVSRSDEAIFHARFRDLAEFLEPGDLLVVNNSATVPAAVAATRADGTALELRIAGPAPTMEGGDWFVVELRARDGSRFDRPRGGERLALPEGASATVVVPYAGGTRLWLARLRVPRPLRQYLEGHARPVRYGYARGQWPLDAYQTVYALHPGSAEMPSAARPFTGAMVAALVARGVLLAPITLHAGLSSPERGETPMAERYRVPPETARLVNAVRRWGGRVIAIGTTVVRALETVATREGVIESEGWTDVVITPERGVRAVDGLLSGWHEPEATHLQMLEAIAGSQLLERSYEAALEHGYLWHEFGDSHLILP